MKKIILSAISLLICACCHLDAQTAEAPPVQPVSSGRGDLVTPGPAVPVTIISDSVAQAPAGKQDAAPGAASGTPAGPEGQPSNSSRKPD